jgi:hypothetical protein
MLGNAIARMVDANRRPVQRIKKIGSFHGIFRNKYHINLLHQKYQKFYLKLNNNHVIFAKKFGVNFNLRHNFQHKIS